MLNPIWSVFASKVSERSWVNLRLSRLPLPEEIHQLLNKFVTFKTLS